MATDPTGAAPAQPAPAFASELQAREHRDSQDALRAEFAVAAERDSGEFENNERIIAGTIARLSPEEQERYRSGTLEDGTSLRLDPETRRAVLDAAIATTPAVLAEAAKRHGGNQKAAIEEMMRSDPFRRGPYWRGPDADLLQRIYRDCFRDAAAESTAQASAQPNPPAPAPKPGAGVPLERVDWDAVRAFVVEHGREPGAEAKGIALLTGSGLTPERARAVVNYARASWLR